MNRNWIITPALAVAGLALVTMGAGVAHAAPGDGGCLSPLVSAGTITQAQADQVRAASKALKDSGVDGREAKAQAISGLVANGTLTQSQADAIAAARGKDGQAREPRGTRTGMAPAASGQQPTQPRVSSGTSGYAQ